MECGSDGENQNNNTEYNNNNNSSGGKVNNSNEGQSKPKRQMKTPFQLETLEKAYASETYPSEATRAELSEKLGLSDRQLQMWFCHRRLKDKKDGGPAKKQRKSVAALPESPIDDLRIGAEQGSDYGSGSGSGSSAFGHTELRNMVPRPRGVGDDMTPGRRQYESRQSIMELRAIACVEAQLGEPLREDGPVLGIEFDSLPPDAFGAPLVAEQPKRSGHPFEGKSYERNDAKSNKVSARGVHEYPFLQDQPGTRANAYGQVGQSHGHSLVIDGPMARTSPFAVWNEQLPRVQGAQGHVSRVRLSSQQDKKGGALPSTSLEDDYLLQRESFANIKSNPQLNDHPIVVTETPYVLSDGQIFPDDAMLRMERKRKNEEARIAREVEANEIRIRKELEKQDILRRKHEERLRKEMEKQDRERRKEEERLIREKQREEERSRREQRREMERREKFLQKEYLRAEKRRQKEELRKEKEAERRKAAVEKATARKIARESMELIEDEQLELMEVAAVRKGLSSIICIDHDTLQSLEQFKDFLGAFPPKSVTLKRPFAIQPWIGSEENIGNLLMVWRFLITFADVLELWPFTLDEFIQAFHDYDSRLLGEIHVSLLKLIIKDIEDVARTPSAGLGMNQNAVANPGGGHPEIVEGAYAWGFDICNWQRHLNPLTWPEIFRQLGLSAGFGPKLKKRNITYSRLPENDEGKGCVDAISTLRNGSAAENAFVIMQEKGLLAPRRSRHRLTPGTVKFAAFHVLSLEGSKGLTVLELADKIQKSGLRDLTTSKTPEASISVALTRDTKLFERIAPSTYRVRTAYRKDPDDAEAILSEARKKIQIFENGFLATEDADDVERDEDSECDDVDEDPEVEDLATPSTPKRASDSYHEVNTCLRAGKENLFNDVALERQNDSTKDSSHSPIPFNDLKAENISLATNEQLVAGEDTSIAGDDASTTNLDEENIEIDESKSGESWIQGLTEGEYYDLSVEERLSALVALVGVANEGNSIRVVLEDRLEAANALKKQMWAEAQLDKSRLKEDNISKLDFPSLAGIKAETNLVGLTAEGSQSPLPVLDDKIIEASPSTADNEKSIHGSYNVLTDLNILPAEKTLLASDFPTGPDNNLAQQIASATKRSRSQLKSYIAHRAEEMYVYRSLPLGQDRRRNRYWQFVASTSSNDPGSGRIFVELRDGKWRLIDTEEAFDALLMSMDARGIRESHLRLMLQKIEASFKDNVRRNKQCLSIVGRGDVAVKKEDDKMNCFPDCTARSDSPSSSVCGTNSDSMETSSSFRIELGKNETEKKAALRRYQGFQRWMWKECFNSSKLFAMKCGKKRSTQLLDICDICLSGSYYFEDSHCSCHHTFSTTDDGFQFSQRAIQCKEKRKLDSKEIHAWDTSLPVGSRLFKALLALIEVSVPPEALQSFWTQDCRGTWGMNLNVSSSTEELLQILTLFESVVKRGFLASNFTTTGELLGTCNQSGPASHDYSDPGSVAVIPWVPHTIAAVALRLFELDASIVYIPHEKPEPADEGKDVRQYTKLSTKFTTMRNDKEIELTHVEQDEPMKEDNSAHLKIVHNGQRRGQGGRDQGRGRRWQKKGNDSKSGGARKNSRGNGRTSQGLRQLGQRTLGQGSGRGRRTVRKRRAENRTVEETLMHRMPEIHCSPEIHYSPGSAGESPRNLDNEWDEEKINVIRMEDDNENCLEVEESDDNAQAAGEDYEQGNWAVEFNGASQRWNGNPMEVSDDEDLNASDDGDNCIEGEEGDGDSVGVDMEMSEGSDEMINMVRNGDESSSSESAVSEDYSD